MPSDENHPQEDGPQIKFFQDEEAKQHLINEVKSLPYISEPLPPKVINI